MPHAGSKMLPPLKPNRHLHFFGNPLNLRQFFSSARKSVFLGIGSLRCEDSNLIPKTTANGHLQSATSNSQSLPRYASNRVSWRAFVRGATWLWLPGMSARWARILSLKILHTDLTQSSSSEHGSGIKLGGFESSQHNAARTTV